jgi:predicted O-methyltransferase YrrM
MKMELKQNLKALISRLRQPGKDLSPPTGYKAPEGIIAEEAEAIQSLCYSDLKYPNTNQFLSFRSYVRMANFAYHSGCSNVLEIGAGLSTAVWARYARRTGARVHTIDIDFGAMKALIAATAYEALVAENVQLIDGATITARELTDFYIGTPKEVFGSVEVTAFADNLDMFKNLNWFTQECQMVAALTSHKNWSACDLVISNGTLVFPRQLLDIYSSGKNFDNEVNMLKNLETSGKTGALDNLIVREASWDMVFLDSGELSSMIEWLKIKDRTVTGGLVAFHDIFFPRSFKNFIVCASILADPDWKVVFIDDSTKQGLLIAQRVGQEG